MLTKNSGRTLQASLSSLFFADEILILDTGSTDETLAIARRHPNTIVYQTPFTGFGELRNHAASLARNDWIFALDSDEEISPLLGLELQALSLDPSSVYEIRFNNFYNNKRIRGCGWDPESHIRLYNRKSVRFSNASVHEGILGHKSVIRLNHPVHHTPYLSISDFLAKMQLYTDLFAAQNRHKKKASFKTALWHAFGAFLKSYLLKRGLFLGSEGFIISTYNGITAFYKYLKLAEANRKIS